METKGTLILFIIKNARGASKRLCLRGIQMSLEASAPTWKMELHEKLGNDRLFLLQKYVIFIFIFQDFYDSLILFWIFLWI